MPRDDKTPICETFEEVNCLIEAENHWTSHKTTETTSINPCDCLDTCNNVEYSVKYTKRLNLTEFIEDNSFEMPKK